MLQTIEVPDTALDFNVRKQSDIPLSLRLYDDQTGELEEISKALGVTRVDLIRRGVDIVIAASKKRKHK